MVDYSFGNSEEWLDRMMRQWRACDDALTRLGEAAKEAEQKLRRLVSVIDPPQTAPDLLSLAQQTGYDSMLAVIVKRIKRKQQSRARNSAR